MQGGGVIMRKEKVINKLKILVATNVLKQESTHLAGIVPANIMFIKGKMKENRE